MRSRFFTRVRFSARATISYGGKEFHATTENLSLQGFYLKTMQTLPMYQPVEVTLSHPEAAPVSVYADVVRIDSSGVGMKIKRIDINSFVALRNTIVKECNDFDGIMHETYRMVACIQ